MNQVKIHNNYHSLNQKFTNLFSKMTYNLSIKIYHLLYYYIKHFNH